MAQSSRDQSFFTRMAMNVAKASGKPATFAIAVLIVVVWAASGPLFGFGDTWQLVINTGTTIVTFLMVFLIQNTQNRDGAAIQAKLDELIRVGKAKNEFIGIEHLSDKELDDILERCERNRPHAVRAAQARADAKHKAEISAARKSASRRAAAPAGRRTRAKKSA